MEMKPSAEEHSPPVTIKILQDSSYHLPMLMQARLPLLTNCDGVNKKHKTHLMITHFNGPQCTYIYVQGQSVQ